MKRIAYIAGMIAVSLHLFGCGSTPIEPIDNKAAIEQKAEDSVQTNTETKENTQTQIEEETNNENDNTEQPIEYGENNCRSDLDCSTCKICNKISKKCEFAEKGTQTQSCNKTNYQCDGQGGCECADNYTGSDCRACKEGFTGANCDQCESWHYGPECLPCTCIPDMGNTCNEGKNGNGQCSSCWDKGWGENCQHTATCVNGKVDKRNGYCSECYEGYSGENCDIKNDCSSIYGVGSFGVNGTGKCASCYNYGDINTNCTTCLGHAVNQGAAHCKKCPQGWTGKKCDQSICNPEGTYYQRDDGSCKCYVSYTGETCDSCNVTWSYRWEEARSGQCTSNYDYANPKAWILYNDECRVTAIIDDRYTDYSTLEIVNKYQGYLNKDINNIFIFGIKDGVPSGSRYEFTWSEAMNMCPKGWRAPTVEEFSEDIQQNIDMRYSHDFWLADEKSNNNNEAYYLKHKKAGSNHTFEFLTANKSEAKRVICVSDTEF